MPQLSELKDFSLATIVVIAVVYLISRWIDKNAESKTSLDPTKVELVKGSHVPCANSMAQTTTQLVTMLAEQQRLFQDTMHDQQAVLQDLIITTKELVLITRETLSHVRDK